MFDRATFFPVLVLTTLCGCDSLIMKLADKEVEVAPEKWITVKQTSSQLIVPWENKTLNWKEEEDETPVCLREWDSNLYLITFDRSNFSKIRFRYYAQYGDGFEEIEPNEFPNRIATQNLWLTTESNGTGPDGRVEYPLDLAVNIDPEDDYFCHSLTAHIWLHLMTGKEYEEVVGMVDPKPLVREYAKKYQPIKLTSIIRKSERERAR